MESHGNAANCLAILCYHVTMRYNCHYDNTLDIVKNMFPIVVISSLSVVILCA